MIVFIIGLAAGIFAGMYIAQMIQEWSGKPRTKIVLEMDDLDGGSSMFKCNSNVDEDMVSFTQLQDEDEVADELNRIFK